MSLVFLINDCLVIRQVFQGIEILQSKMDLAIIPLLSRIRRVMGPETKIATASGFRMENSAGRRVR
jgi:hypothetical protein